MSNPTLAVGIPQYGSKKKNHFKLQDGENIYRILPPLGELAADGVWAVYECIHWGYKGSRGMRTFRCIQKKDFKTKMVKVQCPECDKIAEVKNLLETHEKRLASEGKSKEQIEEAVKPLSDWLFHHNLDKKWYVNAMTQDGKIGRLAIPHKMYVQLQEVITDLVTKKAVDPIGVDGGVWFNLIRSGKGNQTSHRVAVIEETVMADVGGKKMPMAMIKPAPLAQDVLSRLSNDAFDLKVSFKVLSFDEIKRVVMSEGDTDIVDSVFSGGEISDDEPEAGSTNKASVAVNVATTNSASGAAPTSTVTTVAPVATPADLNAARAELEAELASLRSQLSAKSVSVPAPAQTVATTVSVSPKSAAAAMNDDDFIKQFGFSK